MEHHLDYPDIPFHRLLTQAAEHWGERTAIVAGDQRLSFSELDTMAGALANALIASGCAKGDRIALLLPNCVEYAVAFFGACRAGAAPTPLNPAYKAREVRYQLRESGASFVIVHQSLLSVVQEVQAELPDVRAIIVAGSEAPPPYQTLTAFIEGQPCGDPGVALAADDLAALPFSSGTTGTSKGVMLTQRNLVSNAVQFADTTGTTEHDRLLIFLPLYHIYGVALMAFSILCGAEQVLLERFDLARVVQIIEDREITELFVVPPVMLALANTPDLRPESFRSLRFIMSAAAPLAPDIGRRVHRRLDVRVLQAYGMTETSPLTHMAPMDAADEMESVGVVAADTSCRIMDLETGERELAPDEVGEVVIAGPQIMAGYWNAPEETARALRAEWLYTGDVGSVDALGNLYIVDRKKEMIKYKAFSIAPAELEAVLLEHPSVRDCAVTAQADPEAGQVPRAWVVLHADSSTTPEEIRLFVRERVAGYKQIRLLEVVETIPRTPSGKILRRLLAPH